MPVQTGEMQALIRAHPWADGALGPPASWPPALRTTVDIMLGSGFPMFTVWGPSNGHAAGRGQRLGQDADQGKASSCGFNRHPTKPFGLEALEAVLR